MRAEAFDATVVSVVSAVAVTNRIRRAQRRRRCEQRKREHSRDCERGEKPAQSCGVRALHGLPPFRGASGSNPSSPPTLTHTAKCGQLRVVCVCKGTVLPV